MTRSAIHQPADSSAAEDVFAALDADSDGKVSFAEAQAINSSLESTSSTNSATNSEAQVMMKIMQLMHACGSFNDNTSNSSLNSLLSVAA